MLIENRKSGFRSWNRNPAFSLESEIRFLKPVFEFIFIVIVQATELSQNLLLLQNFFDAEYLAKQYGSPIYKQGTRYSRLPTFHTVYDFLPGLNNFSIFSISQCWQTCKGRARRICPCQFPQRSFFDLFRLNEALDNQLTSTEADRDTLL